MLEMVTDINFMCEVGVNVHGFDKLEGSEINPKQMDETWFFGTIFLTQRIYTKNTFSRWYKLLLSYHFAWCWMIEILSNSSLEKIVENQLQGSTWSCDLLKFAQLKINVYVHNEAFVGFKQFQIIYLIYSDLKK